MNKPAHISAGLATGVTASFVMLDGTSLGTHSIVVSSILIATSFVGSVFPDIDHRGSYIGRKFKITSFIVSKTLGHRGATHAPLVLFLLSGLLMFLGHSFLSESLLPYAYLGVSGFFIGAMSHLFLDSLTPAGIPLFYPFSKRSVNLLNIPTGSMLEHVFTLCIWVYMGWFVLNNFGLI